MELTEVAVKKAPGLYLSQPGDLSALDPEVWRKEMEGFRGLFPEDEKKALLAGGEVAGRIDELPTVKELVEVYHQGGGGEHPQPSGKIGGKK